MSEGPCPFCRIAQGEDPDAIVVYEDPYTVAFAPINPATRGHLLVAPRRHCPRVWNLPPEDAAHTARATVTVARAIHDALSPAGLNVIQSNGAVATQTVDHLHVHLVPRWERDRVVLRWPRGAAESSSAQRRTAHRVQIALQTDHYRAPADCLDAHDVSPEDRRQHLEFIQSVISRMASASASAKTWLLPVVTATYGYALVSNDWWVATLGVVATLVFGLLDANYLKQERSFRALYDGVARGNPIPLYSLNPAVAAPVGRGNRWPDRQDWTSWSIMFVYPPILVCGALIVCLVASRT